MSASAPHATERHVPAPLSTTHHAVRRAAPRLANTPVIRRDGQWWLVSSAGSVLATDPVFTGALDRFAEALAAADQAVVGLCARQDRSPTPGTGERR